MSASKTAEAIVLRVHAGDVDAYAEIVRAHQHDIYRVVAYALRDPDATKDLVQQAFVNAYDSLHRYEPGRDFGAWLRAIARNLVREELRRRGREGRRMVLYQAHAEVLSDDDDAADERERMLRDALVDCSGHLAEPARRALDMRYREGKSFDEIGRALDRTVAAARQLLQRVRLSLRECIEARLGAP